MRAKEHQAESQRGAGWAWWDKRDCSAPLCGEAKQDRHTHPSTEHIRILWSRAPSLCPPLPQESWGGLPPPPPPPSPTPMGKQEHLLCHPGGTLLCAPQEEEQLVPGQALSAG